MKALDLFPVTIYQTEIPNNDYLKDLMLSEIMEASEYLNPPDTWSTNKLKTSFESEPEEIKVVEKYKSILKNEYVKCLDDLFDKEYRVKLVDDNIWYNVYTDGEYQELHDHIGEALNPFHWSCIHFLSYNRGEHTPPEFRDPIAQIRQLSIAMEKDWVGEYYVPKVEEGSFLMFPTYLQHRVLPCVKTDYPRVTFSFNLRVLKYGEQEWSG